MHYSRGWQRSDAPHDPESRFEGTQIEIVRPETGRDRAAGPRRAKFLRRATLAWFFGWPPLFITAFVVSTHLHDYAAEVPTYYPNLMNGVTTGESVAFLLGVIGVVIWICGCLALLFVTSSSR
jgi:hypothetical protein